MIRSLSVLTMTAALAAGDALPPNVVVLFTDDQGYADLGSFGAKDIATPRLDALAAQGVRCTDWHSPSPVCTPSRAGLLTGRYPARMNLHAGVIHPPMTNGLPEREVTIAEMLRPRGYATGQFGKWHLGHAPGFEPWQQGFERVFGTPYSNDMSPLFWWQEDGSRIDQATQGELTTRTTDAVVEFIGKHAAKPFFAYVAFNMPHLPLGHGAGRKGKSRGGPYGDVIEELDAHCGRILDALDQHGIAQRTLVVFTSDNGPWLERKNGQNVGSAGPLRDGKGTVWEGGHRVPMLVRLPGVVPAGTTSDVFGTHLDLLPTIAAVTGTPLPEGRKIDGANLLPAWTGGDAATFAERIHVHHGKGGGADAVRQGKWKLHLHTKPAPQLYDLTTDLGEQTDVAAAHPEVVERLRAAVDAHIADLRGKKTP